MEDLMIINATSDSNPLVSEDFRVRIKSSSNDTVKRAVLCANKKLKKSMLVWQKITSCMSEIGRNDFIVQLEKLK